MTSNQLLEKSKRERAKIRKLSLRLIWKIGTLLDDSLLKNLVDYVQVLNKCR